MKKLSPEFKAEAKKKCKTPLIVLGVVLLAVIIAVIVFFCTRGAGETPELQYDDPVQQMLMGNPVDSDDYDNDLVLNEKEAELGLNAYNADTDGDGLGDYYELEHSKTDPLKKDTDDDGLNDFIELQAGLDPTKASTDDTTPDAERTFEEKYRHDDITLEAKGNANIYGMYCAPVTLPGLAQTPGVLSELMEVWIDGKMPEATLTFKYADKDITAKGAVENDLAIFRFTKDGKFEKVENSVLDTEKNTVSCALNKADRYILCDGGAVSADHKNQIMILIDNSGSMFPPEISPQSSGNDVDFKRLDMANSIIDHISENTYYGVAKFTGTYTHMADLGTDPAELKATISGIRDIDETFDGTYIATSIIKSLDNFTDAHAKDRKFIIILTDGGSTEHSGLLGFLSGNPTEYDAVRKCNAANVTVITIALGNDVDSGYLQTIANGTGGAYVYANNADALEDVYDAIFKSLIYSAEDLDDDGETDSYILADSGFNMNRNGFCFENLALLVPEGSHQQHGVCYGMAQLAQSYYRGMYLNKGDAFNGVKKYKDYQVPAYDITAQLNNINNLNELKCEIAEKWTKLHAIPSKERYTYKDGTLMYAEGLLEQFQDEYFTVQTYEQNGTWGGQKYTKVQMVYIDVAKYLAQDTKREDMEIVKALYWLWGAQDAFAGKDKLSVKKYDLRNDWGDVATEEEFEQMKELLNQGIPMTVNFTLPEGGHTINAMRLLRDVDNPLVYYLECYDNNDMNEPYLFKIERSNIDFWTGTNVSNWGENYAYRTYMKNDDEWVAATLEFEVLK